MRKITFGKILYNNTLLKIVSVFTAIILWAYIIIIIDAPTDRTFRDVVINTVNDQVLTDRGYSIEKLSVLTASVKIEGSRKIIAKFDSENISAVLDFSDINTAKLKDEGVVTVNLKVESEFGEVVSFTPSAVDVYVEPTKYKDVDVKYVSSGQLAEGYIPGEAKLSQDKVRIFGAQQNIDMVTDAVVSYDLINTNFDLYNAGSFNANCPVRLYNKDKELTEKESRWIWNNSPEISVRCPIYKVIEAVVVPNITDLGSASAGMFKCDPSSVKIYGDNEKIEEYTQVETVPLTSSQLSSGTENKVKLNLPGWMKTVDDVSEVVVSANSD